MKKYDWILFDADETLFHFDSFAGLRRMLASYSVDFTANDFAQYQAVNKPLWVAYQNGSIDASQLQTQRFEAWAVRLNTSAQELNHAFINAMADICAPMDGVVAVLDALRQDYRLGIITNGFTQLQQTRLERTRLHGHFEVLVISEQVGVAKPDRAIFDHALQLMGQPERARVLMVGDTPESDIIGGLQAGLHTCWLNHGDKMLPEGVVPTYQISHINGLTDVLKTLCVT
ncbi:MAG: pyrimidine 5'-nucleotidase [Formosimonas sp.]